MNVDLRPIFKSVSAICFSISAVNDHRSHADVFQEYGIGREGRLERLIRHRVTTVFDHDGLSEEPLHIGQRFPQNLRLVHELLHQLGPFTRAAARSPRPACISSPAVLTGFIDSFRMGRVEKGSNSGLAPGLGHLFDALKQATVQKDVADGRRECGGQDFCGPGRCDAPFFEKDA